MSTTITTQAATRHEAVYPRLAILLRQVEASANKRPDAPVGAAMQRLAEDLLFEARPFIGGKHALPPAAPDLVGLATQLGQALAALDAFEAAHSAWDADRKAFVWSMRGEGFHPILRLRPKGEQPTHPDTVAALTILRRRVRALGEHGEQQAAERARAAAEEAARQRRASRR